MDVDEFNYYFEHHAFMPASAKDAKKAAADRTIERPARKISMIDGYAEEKKDETPSAEAPAAGGETSPEQSAADTTEETKE